MLILPSLLAIAHGVIAVALIALILLQQGKGADAGASFGGGSSTTVFGGSGAGNFLSRLTGILATLFLVNCMALAYIGKQQVTKSSLLDQVPIEVEAEDAAADGDDTGTFSINPAAPESEDSAVPQEAAADIPELPDDDAETVDDTDTIPVLPDNNGGQ